MTGMFMVTRGGGGCGGKSSKSAVTEDQDKQLSLLDFILSALRKSMVSTCRMNRHDQEVVSTVRHLEIGWPTNVQHVTHVTFDRFHGFLGLPVEFEVEIPCKAPSARCGKKKLKELFFSCFSHMGCFSRHFFTSLFPLF